MAAQLIGLPLVIAPWVGQRCQGLLRLAWGLKTLRLHVQELFVGSLRFTLACVLDTRLSPLQGCL